jgi:AAA15 family ATPase/GTPase
MIIEFSFGNFRSFKDIQSLNMTAAKIKSENKKLDVNNLITFDEKLSLLKSKAIYGANASGKSNVIGALFSYIKIVKNCVKDEKVLNLIDNFQLSTETENKPAFFQMIFIHDSIRYRYGFEATKEEIKSEWLYGTPAIREVPFFIREGNSIIKINKKYFNEGYKLRSLFDSKDEDNGVFRRNSLFLSAVAALNGKQAKSILDSISSIILISGLGYEGVMYQVAIDALDDNSKKEKIFDFLKLADMGIDEIGTFELSKEKISDDVPNKGIKPEKIVVTKHSKYNSNMQKIGKALFSFPFSESEGTKKMFEISPFILEAITKGRTIVIDEFDARFHPLITKKIVEIFNSKTNKYSQLIFVTHDTNLLSADLLRRDQIDFVEKDMYGASHLYTLVQFKGIRKTSFQNDYIRGKYGAIPFIGDFNHIFNTDKDA